MHGYLSLILHAHLPFVRHPEHPTFLEENWLFEAITETYLPLLRILEGWSRDGIDSPVSITLTPTLCGMLGDELLKDRYQKYLGRLIELAEKEAHRTLWEPAFNRLALFYLARFQAALSEYRSTEGDLLTRFRKLQDSGHIEILTCAATHAFLPFLAEHRPSLRSQIRVAVDQYIELFERQPLGIWLPECAYVPPIEDVLAEAGLRWFVIESHGILQANPKPRYGMFEPIITPRGLAVFGRDLSSAKQVWSRDGGYPGDFWYRDFYRDAGYDLDLDYLRPYLASGERRGFTGIKYHRITGPGAGKSVYEPARAHERAEAHASHFLKARAEQIQKLSEILETPPIVVCPYDAELFGHWWYEGIEFLDHFGRNAHQDQTVRLIAPGAFLKRHPTHQVSEPAASSWGTEGYWQVWLNEKNQWMFPRLRAAERQMTQMVQVAGNSGAATPLVQRALKQAARELMLAQSSDWPFIMTMGTSPDYAANRLTTHLDNFSRLHREVTTGSIVEPDLKALEERNNLFPELNYTYFGSGFKGDPP